MGFFKFISNSTLQSLKSLSTLKPHLNIPFQINYTRNYSRLIDQYDRYSLHSRIVQILATSPNAQITPFLDQYVEEGNAVKPTELRKIIKTLRSKNLFDRALEVSQWMTGKSLSPPNSGDQGVQLHLIGQVHGIGAAETFFNNLDDHADKMYGALLSCYVRKNCVDKALSLFKKMKDIGLHTSPLTYNNIMSLYMNIGQAEKVPELLSEMVNNGILPDPISYKICLKSFALKSDFTSLELIVNKMESQPRISMDWSIYATVANYFMEGGYKEKARYYLQKAVDIVGDNGVGYNNLTTMHAKLGDVTQILSLWRKRKVACKACINVDYINMIGSLVKLDEFQEAERLLQEWESSGNLYDFRVPNVLLLGYTRKGLVEKAESVLEGIIAKGKMPIPNTWSIMSAGHIKCQNMDKALQYMKNALEQGPQHQGWLPNAEVTSALLKWLEDSGQTGKEDEFVQLLRRVVPEDHELYRTLLTSNTSNGEEVDSSLRAGSQVEDEIR